MPNSIDIVLNAIDNTAPATNSAIANFNRFAGGASAANAAIAAAPSGGGLLDSLVSVPAMLAIAGAATAAFGAAVATNFSGIQDSISHAMTRATDLVGSFTSGALPVLAQAGSGVMNLLTGSWMGAFTKLGGVAVQVYKQISGASIDWNAVLNTVVSGAVKGFAAVEFAFKNWNTVSKLAIAGVKYELSKFADHAQHIFTKTIPDAIKAMQINPSGALAAGKMTLNEIINDHPILTAGIGNVLQGFHLLDVDEREARTAGKFFDKVNIDAPVSELTKQLEESLNKQLGEVGPKFQSHLDERMKLVPDITKGIKGMGEHALNFASGLLNSDFLKSLLGGTTQSVLQSAALPTLNTGRFTTGVRESGQESAEQMVVKETRKTNDLLTQLMKVLGPQLPPAVAEGIMQALPAIKAGGALLGRNVNF